MDQNTHGLPVAIWPFLSDGSDLQLIVDQLRQPLDRMATSADDGLDDRLLSCDVRVSFDCHLVLLATVDLSASLHILITGHLHSRQPPLTLRALLLVRRLHCLSRSSAYLRTLHASPFTNPAKSA